MPDLISPLLYSSVLRVNRPHTFFTCSPAVTCPYYWRIIIRESSIQLAQYCDYNAFEL